MLETNNIKDYLISLTEGIKDIISKDITKDNFEEVVNKDLIEHINDPKSLSFQKYYHNITNKNEKFLNSPNFFKDFKQMYSLSGINNEYLQNLERDKVKILELITSNKLFDLYNQYFAHAKLMHKDQEVERTLGSFFTKLVHTFKPNEYCALDNPIKNYFRLNKESFYIALFIVSQGYKEWLCENPELIDKIRSRCIELDKKNDLEVKNMTSLKILDLIFWKKANT